MFFSFPLCCLDFHLFVLLFIALYFLLLFAKIQSQHFFCGTWLPQFNRDILPETVPDELCPTPLSRDTMPANFSPIACLWLLDHNLLPTTLCSRYLHRDTISAALCTQYSAYWHNNLDTWCNTVNARHSGPTIRPLNFAIICAQHFVRHTLSSQFSSEARLSISALNFPSTVMWEFGFSSGTKKSGSASPTIESWNGFFAFIKCCPNFVPYSRTTFLLIHLVWWRTSAFFVTVFVTFFATSTVRQPYCFLACRGQDWSRCIWKHGRIIQLNIPLFIFQWKPFQRVKKLIINVVMKMGFLKSDYNIAFQLKKYFTKIRKSLDENVVITLDPLE